MKLLSLSSPRDWAPSKATFGNRKGTVSKMNRIRPSKTTGVRDVLRARACFPRQEVKNAPRRDCITACGEAGRDEEVTRGVGGLPKIKLCQVCSSLICHLPDPTQRSRDLTARHWFARAPQSAPRRRSRTRGSVSASKAVGIGSCVYHRAGIGKACVGDAVGTSGDAKETSIASRCFPFGKIFCGDTGDTGDTWGYVGYVAHHAGHTWGARADSPGWHQLSLATYGTFGTNRRFRWDTGYSAC